MGYQLWIIEAPGKIKTLSEILKGLGLETKIFATRGHFLQMPSKLSELGIDSSFRDYERKPTDINQIKRLREMVRDADSVIVATDADQEGDVIAWDVAEMISDIEISVSRVRLKGMDNDSILEAINERSPVLKEDAIPGRTRALIDRMIGATFSKDGVAVGRVGTALLGLVANHQPSVKRLTLTALDKNGGRPWVAYTDIKKPLTDEIANKLIGLSFPPMSLDASKIKSFPPPHMGDIMVNAVEKLGLTPGETAKAMQRSYEIGKLSYPRAGSRGMSRAAAMKIKKMLAPSNFQFDNEIVKEKEEKEVHDAPYPIGSVNVNLDPMKQGADEGIRTMIAKDLVKSGQKHTEQTPNKSKMISFLLSNGFSENVAKFISNLHWHRDTGPRYPGQESWKKSEIVTRRNDGVLLENAIKAGLGKPSTWGKHIDSFIEKGLVNDDLQLTAKGKEWVQKSPAALLDTKISAAIEKACELKKFTIQEEAEPWETLASKIFNALPDEIKQPVISSIKDIPPQPREDFKKVADAIDIKPQNIKKEDYVFSTPKPPSVN